MSLKGLISSEKPIPRTNVVIRFGANVAVAHSIKDEHGLMNICSKELYDRLWIFHLYFHFQDIVQQTEKQVLGRTNLPTFYTKVLYLK
jgi:hypothetical protein